MPQSQNTDANTHAPPPRCPLCAAPTVLKQAHREAGHKILLVFKCGSCAVEYPVISERED
jgi:hypothetical protein